MTLNTSYNLVKIIDYIEFVLEVEPQKASLHLAAGLVYEALNEGKMMKKHFAIYLEQVESNHKKIKQSLQNKMKTVDCNLNTCNGICSQCAE